MRSRRGGGGGRLLGRQLVLTQAATAKILGIRQPKVSELLRGRLDGFSTDRLVRFITLLGYDVQIKLTKAAGKK
jgi:predicted XRE-type DNA-binding protein